MYNVHIYVHITWNLHCCTLFLLRIRQSSEALDIILFKKFLFYPIFLVLISTAGPVRDLCSDEVWRARLRSAAAPTVRHQEGAPHQGHRQILEDRGASKVVLLTLVPRCFTLTSGNIMRTKHAPLKVSISTNQHCMELAEHFWLAGGSLTSAVILLVLRQLAFQFFNLKNSYKQSLCAIFQSFLLLWRLKLW